jgi:hypothetical protein
MIRLQEDFEVKEIGSGNPGSQDFELHGKKKFACKKNVCPEQV